MTGALDSSMLGKHTNYSSTYNPSLLFPIERSSSRANLTQKGALLPFFGWDIWTAYELSWLNMKGKPQCAVGNFIFPFDSKSIIESKSLKLYLNSINEEKFNDIDEVKAIVKKDLSEASEGDVSIELLGEEAFAASAISKFSGVNIDDLDIEFNEYEPNSSLLHNSCMEIIEETLYSNMFKSNCPVTGQPDWASIQLSYKGRDISKEGLLKYLVSFRNHSGFHENCIERIFCDIMEVCSPEILTVYGRFTRRGGLDINPIRTNDKSLLLPKNIRLFRQ
ncbi:MAG: NADPH-dependent 7-cyano-7-deazaguanine reductase QueF [Lentisphaerota bacterium]